MAKRKPKPKPEPVLEENPLAGAIDEARASEKKKARSRAEIVNDLLDECKKSQLIEIARECVMRDGDWAASIMNAFETALEELDVAQNEHVEASALEQG